MLKSCFKGRLIAIGGNEDKVGELLVLKRVVREIGKTNYRVGVITTASNEPEQRGKEYQKVFAKLGADQVEVLDIRNREQANQENLAVKLKNVDLIFFTGGDQLRLTSIIGKSKTFQVIEDLLASGCLIAGTSAGAAAFSDTMIYDGKSEEGLFKGAVFTTLGFGFVENLVFDTHFITRGRIGRLIQIVTTNPLAIGVGIGEDSGVILRGNSIIEAIGTGQVIVVDGTEVTYSNITNIKHGDPIAVENIKIHSLASGYRYDFKEKLFLKPISCIEKSNND